MEFELIFDSIQDMLTDIACDSPITACASVKEKLIDLAQHLIGKDATQLLEADFDRLLEAEYGQ